MDRQTYEVKEPGVRLDLFLARASGYSRSFIQALIRRGQIKVDGTLAERASHKLSAGNRVDADLTDTTPPSELAPIVEPLSILFEDADLIVINKPPGWVTHPAASYKGPTVVHYILGHCRGLASLGESAGSGRENALRPGIVHRLDKGTSGVLAIAKTRDALENLAAQFKNRTVSKCYHAIVYGDPGAGGEIRSEIARSLSDRRKMQSVPMGGREAVTGWRRLATYSSPDADPGRFSWVELKPETGRTHQLRVHLSEMGFPIIGDPVYRGGRRRQRTFPLPPFPMPEYPLLHAKSLTFAHPRTGAALSIEASPSAPFHSALESLGFVA